MSANSRVAYKYAIARDESAGQVIVAWDKGTTRELEGDDLERACGIVEEQTIESVLNTNRAHGVKYDRQILCSGVHFWCILPDSSPREDMFCMVYRAHHPWCTWQILARFSNIERAECCAELCR